MSRLFQCAMHFVVGVGCWAAIVSATSGKAHAATYVYVSVAGKSTIAQFSLDMDSGELKDRVDLQVGGAPGCLAVSPDQRTMYAAIRTEGALMSLRMAPGTGRLEVQNSASAGNSAYVSTDRRGKYLFSAYYQAGKIAVHSLGDDGKIEPRALQTIETAKNAHCLLTDRSNRFAFVPHTGPNCIYQFLFDEDQGKLTANAAGRYDAAKGAGPRHIFFHPSQPWAYTSDELGSSVTAFRLDKRQGTLIPIQSLSTLPEGFTAKNTCSDVEVTPDGKLVLVGNRGHDSIARYAVDGTTGKLTPLGQTSTEKTPRSFNVDPSGRFVVAAGQGSGKLAVYRIDDASGNLERLHTVDVGPGPSWVQIVRLAP